MKTKEIDYTQNTVMTCKLSLNFAISFYKHHYQSLSLPAFYIRVLEHKKIITK